MEQTGVHGSIAALRIRAVMMLIFATTRLQAQNLPQAGQSPGHQNPTAQNQSPVPTALPTLSSTGPLQAPPANTVKAGPLGKLNFNCLVSGMGLWQGNPVLNDNSANGAPNSVKLFLQKTTSSWQFYVIAGAYNILAVGTPFISTRKTVFDFYSPVPVAYVKFAPTKSTSIQVGSLPTLMGKASRV